MNIVSFLKKNEIIKLILILLGASMLINIFALARGYAYGDIIGMYKKEYEDSKALNNPKEYLEDAIFVVDTTFIEVRETNRNKVTRTSSKTEFIIIRGTILNDTVEQELVKVFDSDKDDYNYNPNYKILYNASYININGKRVSFLKVLKNKINNTAFLTDKEYLDGRKVRSIFGLSMPFISVLLFIILLIIRIK